METKIYARSKMSDDLKKVCEGVDRTAMNEDVHWTTLRTTVIFLFHNAKRISFFHFRKKK